MNGFHLLMRRATAGAGMLAALTACGSDKPTGPGGEPRITKQLAVAVLARDLAYDSTRQLLYASVASTDQSYGNRVVAIDPAAGVVRSSVFVGSEPTRLAISDNGQFLYVGIDGARSVRRVVLADFTAELQFPAKATQWTAAFVADDFRDRINQRREQRHHVRRFADDVLRVQQRNDGVRLPASRAPE